MNTLVVLGVVLAAVVWKYRDFTKYIIYFELVYRALFAFVPFSYTSNALTNTMYEYLLLYLAYSCSMRANYIAVIVVCLIQ